MKIGYPTAPPYFPLYPKDFLTDDKVILMTDDELGNYFRLLCIQWMNNGVDGKLLNKSTDLVKSCFKKKSGNNDIYFNKRLDFERKKLQEILAKKSEGGRKAQKIKKISEEIKEDTSKTASTQFQHKDLDLDKEVEKDLKETNLDSISNLETTENLETNKKDLSSKSKDISTDGEESNQIYKNIFDYWNTRNETLHHRKFAGTIRDRIIKSINGRVEEGYSEQDIITSIKNYCAVLRNPDQFFKHQWPLDIFLSRSNGFINFIDSARPWDKWLIDKPKGQKVQEHNRALVEKFEREERQNGFGNYEEGNVIDINQDCGDF